MKYFSCDKWWQFQSLKVLKALIDQRNGVITPLTFLIVDSRFHGLSISQGPPHPAVRLTDSFCVRSLTSVLWLLVTKHVWGWERGVFPVLECTVSAEPPPTTVPVRSAAGEGEKGRPTGDVELWVTPEREKGSGGGRGVRLHACFIAWSKQSEEHKWQRGEEVGNIILKCTDKSTCASTERAVTNTWCFFYKHIAPPRTVELASSLRFFRSTHTKACVNVWTIVTNVNRPQWLSCV